MATFDVNYPQNPWADMTTKTRPWYVPDLYSVFRREAIYNRFTGVQFNPNGPRATEMYVDSLLMPHANHNAIGLREYWLDSSYMDTYRRKITFSRYGGKFSLNRYDDLVTYYLRDGKRGLSRIIQEGLGYQMTGVLDKLARDAFLKAPFAMYGIGTGTSFNSLAATDTLSTSLIDDIQLGMKERDIPGFATGDGSPGAVVCITSPGTLRDLRYEASSGGNANQWIDVMKYQQSVRLINGEVGQYHGVRFVETNNAVLYNCGAISTQTTITSAVQPGDGAPDPANTLVDNVEYVGQPGKTHSIAVTSSSGFAVGDILTLHAARTNAFGVTNGVDYRDGRTQNLRVAAIPDGTHITFTRPIMEGFTTDLGGGVYGYVTKGVNVHTAIFIGAPNGVVSGVAQAPTLHTPPPIDDLDQIFRFSWDSYLGYQVFEPTVFEVAYLKGSNRIKGPRYVR
jgi:hypothetical protein